MGMTHLSRLVRRPGPAYVGAVTAHEYVSRNPANLTDVVATIALGDADALVRAARAAKGAQRAWADVPAPVRGRVIANLGRLVEANSDALAALVTREIGKPAAEARGEVQEVVDTCDFFLGEGRRLYGQTVPSEMPDKQLFTFRVPVGAVAVLTAGNFPVAVPSWYLIPALVAGRVRCRLGHGAVRADPGRGPARWRAQHRLRRGRGGLRRP